MTRLYCEALSFFVFQGDSGTPAERQRAEGSIKPILPPASCGPGGPPQPFEKRKNSTHCSIYQKWSLLFFLFLSLLLCSFPGDAGERAAWSKSNAINQQFPVFFARAVITVPAEEAPKDTRSVADKTMQQSFDIFGHPSLITQAVTLTLLSMLPFIVMILTSFLKIVIVLSLLRSALGVQQAPPNQIINGVAFMLSLFIMYPTMAKMYDISQNVIMETKTPESLTTPDATTYIMNIASKTREPLRDFLKKNSSSKHQALFYRMAYRVLPEEHRKTLKPDDFMMLVPAYITSQLKDAFEIGVLIYIPFFVIDLVTSNILLAMGMMMLSPVTISMPLKLFLLVMLDGWTLLIEGLVNTFR